MAARTIETGAVDVATLRPSAIRAHLRALALQRSADLRLARQGVTIAARDARGR